MSQFKYVLKLCGVLFSLSRKLFVLTALQITISSAQPIVSVILSAHILRQLIDIVEPVNIVYTAVILVGINMAAGIAGAFLRSRISILNDAVKDDFCLLVGQKIMNLPYEQLEDPALLDLKQQTLIPIIQWGNFEFILNEAVPKVLGSVLTIAATAAIVVRGNLFLLIPILVISALCMFISEKRQRVFNENMMRVGLIERKMGYYGQLAVDFSSGKDIRLFVMNNIIMKIIGRFIDKELFEFTRMLNSTTRYNIFETVMMQIQIFVIYGIAAYDVLNKGLPLSSFFEITGLFINAGASVFMLLSTIAAINVRGRFLEKYFEFASLPEDEGNNDTELINTAQEIKICNISFTYNHTDKQVLNNINLTIPAGKKVAFVGENGSGKTTLIKLICGLLIPTEGNIQIGDCIVRNCARERVSAVFQDFKLFAFSIRENIEMSAPGKADTAAVLERLGLLGDINNLDMGIETPLFKSYDDAGMELSGGQGQKLAIARAMYKDAGVTLLDEPTAALDPKAEADIFNNFQTITTGKTAVLVSHRLSSCRFCDHIIVLDDGCIIEQGTHDELMMHNGKYTEMFTAQAEYYK